MRRGKLSEEAQGRLPEAGGSDWAKVLSQDQIPRSSECVCVMVKGHGLQLLSCSDDFLSDAIRRLRYS